MRRERGTTAIISPDKPEGRLGLDEIQHLNFIAAKNVVDFAIMNLLDDEKRSFTPIRPKKRNGKKNEYTSAWIWSRPKKDENDTIEAEAYIRIELDRNNSNDFLLVLGSDIRDAGVVEDTWQKEYYRQRWNIHEVKNSEGLERLTAVICQGMTEGDENPMTDLQDAALLLRQARRERQTLQK